MSRNLGVGPLIGLIVLGGLGVPAVSLHAQDSRNIDPGITPSERVDRGSLTRPDLRVGAADPNTGKPADPRIDALLDKWSQRTKQIKKLQGRHMRATRDFAFGTESWAEGKFYVEMPDKGRIDVEPYSKSLPDPKKVLPRRNPAGRFVKLDIVKDTKHDRWICDGKEIKVVNDDDKTYEAVKIPPNQRGVNIMDGPLPFLFGMPPDKAKARYEFKLLEEKETAYAIQVRPNWKQDAVDWAQAELLLDRTTFLPREVHLHNAAGTTETVYLFSKPEINSINYIFWRDPFAPSLTFYRRSVHNNPAAGPNPDPLASHRMPSLIGLNYWSVEQKLKTLGYNLQRPMRGDPATAAKQVYCIQKQDPPPNAPFDKDTPIVLTLYGKMIERDRTAAKPPDP